MKNIDISEDSYLVRMNNGISLIHAEERKYIPLHYNLNRTVKDFLTLPCNIYFSDIENRYQLINEPCAEICGFDAPKSALNKLLTHTSTKESSNIIYNNNNEVLQKNRMRIFEEELTLNDDSAEQGVSIKLPWYNMKKEIIGIFGITIISQKQPLGNLLNHFTALGLLNNDNFLKFDNSGFYFTKREKEIIYLIQKNISSKQMANQLYVSCRTIEKHIENIKNKLNVKSKSDIIAKILEQ